MDYRLAFPTEYIAAPDLRGKDHTRHVAKVFLDDLRLSSGASTTKLVIKFRDAEKKLVVNKTNAITIAEMYGVETDDWVGKPITMYPTTTQFGRDTVDCVRIRSNKPESDNPDAPPPGESL